MHKKLILAAICSTLVMTGQQAPAQEAAGAKSELQGLVVKVNGKLKEGKRTESDLKDELKEFDDLLTRHHGEKTDEVAQILFMKALLYTQVFKDDAKGGEMLKQLEKDYPGTKPATAAEGKLKEMAAAQLYAVGKPFPDFNEKDVHGKAMSVANYKGKVVLVDFWATWCGPCVGELPNVLAAYEKFHGKGFEILGISLDDDAKKLSDFTESKKVVWQQYFDGKGWGNKLAGVYGIHSIPATFLLDGEGKIIGKNLRGEELSQAVEKALAKK